MIKEKREGKTYPKRIKAIAKFKDGREVPVTFSCRSDGECVVLPRPMEEVLFPKVMEKGEKAKKEVKK